MAQAAPTIRIRFIIVITLEDAPVGIPDARFRRMSKIAGSVARCRCELPGNVL